MKLPLTLFAGAMALGLTINASAAEQTTPPAPGPAPSVVTPTPVEKTLDNGLRVIVVRRASLPLVTAQLSVLSGSEVDPTSRAGSAAMTAQLLTRGTTTRTAPQIAQAAAALGGAIAASAGWDETDIDITVTTPKIGAALDLLADVTMHPKFAAAEIERARKQAVDGLRLAYASPRALSRMVARRAVFGAGMYGHPAAGTPASLKAITRAGLVRLHGTYYRPDNAVLVFAGDIQPKAAFALAKKSFGDWARPDIALPKPPGGTADSSLPQMVSVDLPGAGQAGVIVAHQAIARDAKDYFPARVANAVLGGSYSARLNEEVRIKRGLSYGASSHLAALRHGGWLVAAAQTKNRSAPQVVDLILKEFAKLASAAPTKAELTARKATLTGSFGRSLETTAGLARQISERAVYGIDPGAIDQFIGKVDAVTPAQVQAFARAHLGRNETQVVIVGDASIYRAALTKAWPHAARFEAAKLNLARADLQRK